MCLRIGRIDKLSGDKAARNRGGQLICLGNRALHALCALGEHQLRAVSTHELSAFDGHGLRHDDDDAIAACRRDRRKADARVAGGRLDDGRTRLQNAACLGVVDHGLGDAVLDGTGGIKILQFCKNLCLQAVRGLEMRQLQQRRMADELVGRGVNMGHGFASFLL